MIRATCSVSHEQRDRVWVSTVGIRRSRFRVDMVGQFFSDHRIRARSRPHIAVSTRVGKRLNTLLPESTRTALRAAPIIMTAVVSPSVGPERFGTLIGGYARPTM